jgi:2'-5' RNA ligase
VICCFQGWIITCFDVKKNDEHHIIREKIITMRTFIAIDIPDALRSEMNKIIGELKKCGADVRWVKVSSIHLTMKFLGEIPEEVVEKIIKKIEADVPGFDALKIRLAELGGFPNLNRPRVIWLGAMGIGEGLKVLHKEIEKSLQSLGFAPENRDFKPHLTLGRVKSPRGLSNLTKMVRDRAAIELGEFTADSYYLFQSILKPTGAEYRKVHQFILKK